ncbi:unnamed protein product [Paramecium pentaurelia]|uniref:Protein-serine/threonine phosphatase n=1 Tax=Paramecium pentaurelia TaxID=43138 RepID=A0A8S1YI13_9CILI|nr:unnamed protein product [Paramecium pentaurelia]
MKKKQLERDEQGNLIMNEQNIIEICEKEGLYEYPELNSKLYLHFKAFRKIGGLDNFINVKTLWLENNFITRIEGLENLQQLTHLFLQNNLIQKIEGLRENLELITLNLSNNCIKVVENLQRLQKLSSLDLSTNKLQSVSDIWELELNQSVSNLDLSNNMLEFEGEHEDDPLLLIFKKMPKLKCLYLQRNNYIRSIQNYRKYYLANLPELTYLDTQPVFPNERRIVDAWGKLGKEGEQIERQKIKDEEDTKKQEYREEIKKQLPVYLQSKINFFQKNINAIETEIQEMQARKQNHIEQNSQEIEITFLDASINQKQSQLNEMNELLDNMKVRQIRQNSMTESQLIEQRGDQQEKIQIQLDEID